MNLSNTATMKWASALSLETDVAGATTEAVTGLKSKLGNRHPDVVFVFVSAHFRPHYQTILVTILRQFAPAHVLGCSGAGVLGDWHEAEQVPALALAGAVLPNVQMKPLRLTGSLLPGSDSSPRLWEEKLGLKASAAPQFILLADSASINVDDLLAGLDFAYPQAAKIGGLASGGHRPGQDALFLDSYVFHDGAVGLALSGDVRLDTVVAQGCRPFGPVLAVTKCEPNVLLELDHRPALEILRALYRRANARDQDLMPTSLHLGLLMDPFNPQPPGPGDFLIRTPIGMDAKRGALLVAARLHDGQIVQFHLRDPRAASEELLAVLRSYGAAHLAAAPSESVPPPPRGALAFCCAARGKRLYGAADHDTHAFRAELGDVPLTGFFANGEIGPVGGNTYLHGFTSCFGIFGPK
ncbi:MAG: FIST N-terminal domain-containing protein [Planctomycetota bacterium]